MANFLSTSYHNLAKKNDNRRIWIEGAMLLKANFKPGDYFSISLNVDTLLVSINHIPDSPEARARHKRKEIRKVSRRKCTGWVKPIIDICNADITNLFGEFSRFRAQSFAGRIDFGIHPEDLARAKREKSFLENISKGTITKGDAFLGFGVKSDSLREGFKAEGIQCDQKWVIEIESRYLDVATLNSPEVYQDTNIFCGKIEEVEKHLLEPVDAFAFSMACTNHSLAGRTKKKLKNAEMGDEVTSLFGVVETIKAVNPAVLFSENVPSAKGSTTYLLLIKELNRLGYECKEMMLNQTHGGCLENRSRYWLVAYSKGLSVNVDNLMPQPIECDVESLGEVMETGVEHVWHDISKLTKRDVKNKQEGRGFSINLVDATSTSVSTIPRTYGKHQVSNPHIVSPCGKFYRLLTKREHAAVKRVPERLIGHCAATEGHEGLGQGISYFQAFGLSVAFMRSLSLNSEQHSLAL